MVWQGGGAGPTVITVLTGNNPFRTGHLPSLPHFFTPHWCFLGRIPREALPLESFALLPGEAKPRSFVHVCVYTHAHVRVYVCACWHGIVEEWGIADFLGQGMELAEETWERRQSAWRLDAGGRGAGKDLGKDKADDRGLREEGVLGERGFPPNAKLPRLGHDWVRSMKQREAKSNSSALTLFPFH